MNRERLEIVIVGGGIIGCTTAYYLTRYPDFNPRLHHITIIESNDVACAASGKAGGLLASWAFPSQIGPISFSLHKYLANEYDGEKNWDYRSLHTISLEADIRNVKLKREKNTNSDANKNMRQGNKKIDLDFTMPKKNMTLDDRKELNYISSSSSSSSSDCNNDSDTSTISDEEVSEHELVLDSNKHILPTDLTWIKRNCVKSWSSLSDENSTAQIHPFKFCQFILQKAVESGAVDLVYGKVVNINIKERKIKTKNGNEDSECYGVSYIPVQRKEKFGTQKSTKIERPIGDRRRKSSISDDIVTLEDIDKTIICTGPWTSRLLPDCPISGLRAHSITIKPKSVDEITPYALFTELKVGDIETFSPEVYARKDEVYVCGEGDSMIELPDATQDTQVTNSKCEQLYTYASKLSSNLANGRILKKQACYLPVLNVATSSGPLLGETNVKDLYVASGHSCWGINNSAATGKIMSEIIFEGEAISANIDKLDPKLYFDAKVLNK